MFRKSTDTDLTHQPRAVDVLLRRTPPSILSADMRILGNIISEGTVDIDGHLDGNVRAHHATVRKHGRIKGDVVAETVHVYGAVEGVIRARHVHLKATARVEGVIVHEAITIEDGAFVDGQFERMEKVALDGEGSLVTESDDDVFRRLKLISG